MKKIFNLFIITALFFHYSCIDRDTIAGTGKEIPESIIGISGNHQSGVINNKITNPLKIRILASNGRPVRGVIVAFSVENNNAIFSDTNATTNGDGYAQTTVTLGSKADSVRIYASVIGLKGSPVIFTLLAVASGASSLGFFDGDNQTGNVGEALSKPLKVKVTDLYNNPVRDAIVYYSTTNGGWFQPSQVRTDSFGIASSYWILDTTVGVKIGQAFVPSISKGPILFSATATSLLVPSYFFPVTNDTLIEMEDTQVKFIVQVRVLDKFKNPVYRIPAIGGGISVQFNVSKGRGSVSAIFNGNQPDSNGYVYARAITDNISLPFGVTADVGFGMSPINFTLLIYKYLQLDSVRSSGGVVTVNWQKNMNPLFANYTLQRCYNNSFDNSTTDVKVISNENINFTDDTTAVVGTSPFYRVQVNYSNGFYVYTNYGSVIVQP